MDLHRKHIEKLFGGRLVGSEKVKRLVVEVVARLDDETAH